MSSSTPMMKQYWAIKKEHPDAILFFRMGDFYEMFGEDAKVAAKAMNITLTTRDKGSANPAPMCGVPFHALDSYLPKMIRQGFKVAICEQVEDPRTAKGVVKRAVVRVVTPGAVMEPALLEDGSFNFLAAVAPSKRGFGLAVADLSTGLFRACEFIGDRSLAELENELDRTGPKQILIPDNLEEAHPPLARALGGSHGGVLDKIEGWSFGHENARQVLLEHFKTPSLDGFGLEGMDLAVAASGAAIRYLLDTQKSALDQIGKIIVHNPYDTMPLDPATRRNLELTHNLVDNRREGSLLSIMDDTKTAMGARTLKEWILRPLINVANINDRLATVRTFVSSAGLLEPVREKLAGMGDLERIAGRVTLATCSPRDLAALARSLETLPALRAMIDEVITVIGERWRSEWDDLADVRDLLSQAIADAPPALARDGGAIRPGYSERLDDLRAVQSDSKKLILDLEEEEKRRTGIAQLRIKYNKIYGYFIEVSRRQAEQAPDDWMRKQSLVNTERFISPKLKEFEDKIMTAEERAMDLEIELYEKVRADAAGQARRAQAMAAIVGEIDALSGLAALALRSGYVEPVVDDGDVIEIKGGRHPILEKAGLEERFVPNDTQMDRGDNRLSIVTGPNMAGKSTFIRQTAAICLMAQMGSFVPAQTARIGVVDRIFTRVGAQDYLQRGQSTFMVEMNETALILNNATNRSLIILDEIGRGTSTFDGVSIAWAVAEYIHKLGARTLFATHYHELTELSDSLDGVRNLSVAVREWNEEIIFLRKIVEEGADKSYGIQVARLAGLPGEVIARAGEVLTQLEANELDASGHPKLKAKEAEGVVDKQADLFTSQPSEVEEKLKKLDLDSMTPIEALNMLEELRRKMI